jgi:hypothetical protein
MTLPTVTLTHPNINGGSPVRLLCNDVRIAGKKNVNAQPSVNVTQISRALTQSFENPVYTINPVYITNDSNTFTYEDCLVLYKMRYDNTNAAILNVRFGNNRFLVSADTQSTNIKVLLEDYTYNINARDSKDGYRPKLDLKLVETR